MMGINLFTRLTLLKFPGPYQLQTENYFKMTFDAIITYTFYGKMTFRSDKDCVTSFRDVRAGFDESIGYQTISQSPTVWRFLRYSIFANNSRFCLS